MKRVTLHRNFFLFLLLTPHLYIQVAFGIDLTKSNDGPGNLLTEYLKNPMGIDEKNPRLSWRFDHRYAAQKGYRVYVATDADFEQVIWDSGDILSSSNQAAYAGEPLSPFTTYYWKVGIRDEKNSSYDSGTAFFETGMMQESNWKGAWLSDQLGADHKSAPYFRKTFDLQNKRITKARAYIAVGGLYELYLNGEKIGNHRLDPAFTRFDRRLLYVTHDVTENLLNAENTIGVLLGNGWYNHQSMAVWFFDRAPWRNRPAFCLDIRITFEDGSEQIVSTDRTWKTSADGPLLFNSIYTAEHYDARLENAGWNQNGYDDAEWKEINLRASPSNKIVSQQMHPIRANNKLVPVEVRTINDTTYLFDFGQNISGVTELQIQGEEGTVIRLEHGERLDDHGRLDMSNIDVHYRPIDDSDPFQTDIITLSGNEDSFMPKFNYKGFQYVEVTSSKPILLTADNLSAYFMHSDVPALGMINSSDSILNKIWKATNNAYLSNLFGYPTDCPQREKNGWTGDGHIAIETGLYNFDGITIYEKWINDHLDEQQPNGVLPAIIPTSGWGYQWANGPDWTSTIAIIPWNIYLFYGDATLLDRSYEALKKYINYIDHHYPSGLTDWGLGDWVPVNSRSNLELTSSIYYYVGTDILAKSAKILGYAADRTHYAELAQKIKDQINNTYLDTASGIYASGTQTELSMPLYWKVTPEESIAKVAYNLAEKARETDYHLDVGLLGTKAILHALSENGHAEAAYRIASQENYPSWGWWIKNGATTLYENWNIDAENDISLNHIMFGEIGAWYYKGLAGIKPVEHAPGFAEIELTPFIPADLTEFSAQYTSVRGDIRVFWKTLADETVLHITIPSNAKADFHVPSIANKTAYLGDEKIVQENMILFAGNHIVTYR